MVIVVKSNRLRISLINLLLISLIIGLLVNDHNGISTSPIKTTCNDYSIILMIGDGMGFNHVKLARYIEVGKDQRLTMENLQLNFSVMTHNVQQLVTDSAAAATAMATGYKTINGKIAILPNGISLPTILELAQEMDKATGLVTTTSILHATPASFMTHVDSRNDYNEITRQIVEEVEVDILLGGGKKYFSSVHLETMENKGYSIVENKSALLAHTSRKLLGLFADSHMDYEITRNYELTPSLADMTQKAITILDQNPNGFFLMVEGGRIDHGSHDNEKDLAALEAIEFELAVRKAVSYVKKHSNTILIITADHETGGLTIVSDNLNETIPQSSFTEEQNRTIRINRVNQIEVAWSTGGHTNQTVPFFALGEPFENLTSNLLIDNTDIFTIMHDYYLEKEIVIIGRTLVVVSPIKASTIIISISIVTSCIIWIRTKRKTKQQACIFSQQQRHNESL